MLIPYHDDNASHRTPWVTIALIVVNVVVMFRMARLDPAAQQEAVIHWGFVPARLTNLPEGQLVQINLQRLERHRHLPVLVQIAHPIRLEADGRQIATTLLTSLFIHGGWMHLVGNMWFLWLFGNNVEDRLGRVLFLVFYLLGGLIATTVHWWTEPASLVPVVGASGAISAVLGAYLITFPHARIHTFIFLGFFFTVVDFPAFVVLGVWFLLQLLEGTQAMQVGIGGGVAWWAHVGGFVAGIAMMPVFAWVAGPPPPARPPRSPRREEDDVVDDRDPR